MKSLINHYQILNISHQASQKEIRLAFLKLAKKYHPDKNKGNSLAEKRFKQINRAYQVLKDSQKRKILDEQLKACQQKPSVPSQPFQQKLHKSSPPLFVQKIFPKKNPEKPLDLEVSLPVTLEELCQSATKTVVYMRPFNGKKTKSVLTVQIPQGASEHSVLHFKNKGGAQGKKQIGSLFIKLNLKPHAIFTVKNQDVFISLPVRLADIVKEASIKIPSPHGAIVTHLSFSTKNHHILRFKGLGLPQSTHKKGDMFVKIIIDYPVGYKVKIQQEMKGLSHEKQKQYIQTFDSQNTVYKKVLEFEKNLKVD